MQNKVFVDTFDSLGTNPVPMAFSEVYVGLESKTLESMKQQGLQVNDVSAAELQRMRERVQPVVDAQAKAIGVETMAAVDAELKRIREQAK